MSEILRSVSPADPGDEIGNYPVWDEASIGEAVDRARAAFPAWRDAGPDARAAVLRRFQRAAEERSEEIARLVAREVGKALWDARAEARLLPAKVAATLDDGLRLVETLEVGPGARATFRPRGVLAVLGPFNFPAHLPNGHIVPALATGNTVVLKPSDQAPAVGDLLFRLFRDAGLPPGVLEVVQGGGETGRTLALHPDVDGVLFTGSWPVGRALAEATLDQPHKILALEMGGKNAMVVLEDADLANAAREAVLSSAATAGQRCTSLSRLFVARSRADELVERMSALYDELAIGPPLEEGTFMGPLVSRAAWDRTQARRQGAEEAGGERIYRREINRLPPYTGPTIVRFEGLEQGHPYQREEMFAPEVALYAIDDLDEAIAAVNDSDYGLAASVMTRDRARYEHCIGRIDVGVLNWNCGTIGASGRLPFGGSRRSGNDRPAGISASLYCTAPQAHLERPGGTDPAALPPGFPRP